MALTGATVCIEVDSISTDAHPADNSAWVPHNECEVGCVFHHHGSSPDKSVGTDRDSANNRTICSQRCSLANQGRSELIHPPNFAPWVDDISEHHGRATKDLVFQGHT